MKIMPNFLWSAKVVEIYKIEIYCKSTSCDCLAGFCSLCPAMRKAKVLKCVMQRSQAIKTNLKYRHP